MHEYFISFQAGSGGRFIHYVLYNLLTGIDDDLKLTVCNAAHLNNYYSCVSVHPHGLDIYRTFTFDNREDNTPKILFTHTYPEFNVIEDRFENPRVILITVELSDVMELSINNQYKNGLVPRHTNPGHYGNKLTFLNTLPIVSRWIKNGAFMGPHPMYPFVLDIKYKEIFTPSTDGKYVALSKLEEFVDKKASSALLQNYEKYVVGRKKFLELIGLSNHQLPPEVLGC